MVGCGYAADEQEGGKNHSSFDGDSQIGENCKRKSHQPDADIGLRQLEQLRISRHSPMLYATTIRIPASAAMGT